MINLIKWLATGITLIGALLTSLNYFPYNVYAFNIGCVLWIFWAWKIREMSVVFVNVGLLLIYLIGAIHGS
jgi:hypothetical protein